MWRCAGLPWTLIAMPSCTVVTSAQVSGQSWGHAPRTVVVAAAFMVGPEQGMPDARPGMKRAIHAPVAIGR